MDAARRRLRRHAVSRDVALQQRVQPRIARGPDVVVQNARASQRAHSARTFRIQHQREHLFRELRCIGRRLELDTTRASCPQPPLASPRRLPHRHRFENLVLNSTRHPERSHDHPRVREKRADIIDPTRHDDGRSSPARGLLNRDSFRRCRTAPMHRAL